MYRKKQSRLTIPQIEQLFSVYNITLGSNEQERLILIPAIQQMDRANFEILLQSLECKDFSIQQYIDLESVVVARDTQVSK